MVLCHPVTLDKLNWATPQESTSHREKNSLWSSKNWTQSVRKFKSSVPPPAPTTEIPPLCLECSHSLFPLRETSILTAALTVQSAFLLTAVGLFLLGRSVHIVRGAVNPWKRNKNNAQIQKTEWNIWYIRNRHCWILTDNFSYLPCPTFLQLSENVCLKGQRCDSEEELIHIFSCRKKVF